MSDILPEPTDIVTEYRTDKSGFTNPRVKRTMTILISLVIIALLCLLAGYSYDVIHNDDLDNTRRQDLSYIAGVADGYYNLLHYYPTLNQINSSTFGAFMPSLNREKFRDPSSNNELLLAQPAADGYAYEVSPAGCNNSGTNLCTSYKLVAILSNNNQYDVVGSANH